MSHKYYIKQNTKVILAILILPAIIAELLSGSAPPLEFIIPTSFLFWGLLYGCGTLLIREAKVRWNMQWSVIFLAIAYGIIVEGLTSKAFFNINWADVGHSANYGTFFGILISWSIMLLTFHATISTLIPILIVDLTWPKYKKTSLIGKKGLILTFIGLISIVLIGFKYMGTLVNGEIIPYYPSPMLILGCICLIVILVFAGYKLKDSKINTNNKIFGPKIFAILAFLFMLAFIIAPSELAKYNINQLILVTYQIIVIIIALAFAYFQIYNPNITKHHLINIVFGSLLFFSIYGVLLELQGSLGMSLVGIISLIILIKWKKKIIRKL